MNIRIGNGFDVHRLVEGRQCVLCGVNVPYDRGLLGHSDADVAIHALIDALLGALALGDIGRHYPDTDDKWKNVNSRLLLQDVKTKIHNLGWRVNNVDITIMAQEPKLKPFIEQMRLNIADDLEIDMARASVKATTTEGLGFTGRKEGIAAMATALLTKE